MAAVGEQGKLMGSPHQWQDRQKQLRPPQREEVDSLNKGPPDALVCQQHLVTQLSGKQVASAMILSLE